MGLRRAPLRRHCLRRIVHVEDAKVGLQGIQIIQDIEVIADLIADRIADLSTWELHELWIASPEMCRQWC